MLLSTVYAVTRRLLSLPALLLRSEVSTKADLLVLRHENAVLASHQVHRTILGGLINEYQIAG